MKESFDDNNFYTSAQEPGSCGALRNYRQVIQTYTYDRYEHRFRQMANGRHLTPQQRPKLDREKFQSLMTILETSLTKLGDAKLLHDERNLKIVDKVLLFGLLIEDWGG